MTENLSVDPAVLAQASAGINGVIDGLADTGVGSDYSAAIGRGYGDLDLDGRTIGHADPKSGLEEYCNRWEWGVRALITGAAEISKGLGLGASHYEREEKWAGDQLKNYTMDLIGDPNLTPEQVKEMSWGQLWDHNGNVLSDPQWALTPEEMERHRQFGEDNRATLLEDLETIGRHQIDPSSLVTDTIDGFERDGFTADSPSGPQGRPADKPEAE
ncbi:hypothetical protein [Gordonia terrae]|uniref:hypothetical protein n=1 Tax=Gordonia terrae TaxID=2055 RepID=UPI003F6D3CA0